MWNAKQIGAANCSKLTDGNPSKEIPTAQENGSNQMFIIQMNI